MPANQVLRIKVLNAGGIWDTLSEQEAAFLGNSLGMFINVKGPKRSTPRANLSLVRAWNAKGFYEVVSGDEHVLHLTTHGTPTSLKTGDQKYSVTAADFEARATSGAITVAPIVVSTLCNFQSADWQSAFRSAGAKILIASKHEVSPANLMAFDMAFYSALLSRIRKTRSLEQRVESSFKLAVRHYNAVHAPGADKATFTLEKL